MICRLLLLACLIVESNIFAATVTGTVVDEKNRPLPCRLYIQNEQGNWFFAKSAAADGVAIQYNKERKESASVEVHTSLSAHPFAIDLPPGRYTFSAERGHEYLAAVESVSIADAPVTVKLKLKRWSHLAEDGWYSGDTHVHRTLKELPTLQLAEDLNVAFPLTQWVTKAYTPPPEGEYPNDAPARAVHIDPTHCYFPRNTEYEIFSVGAASHTLGAFFVLNHKMPFKVGVPPVQPVLEQARKEGALLELDKHNWPWSMAIIPVMNIDLFELTNNHLWRTNFAFKGWGEKDAAWMNVEKDATGAWTEAGWRDFGFQNYYALLNCGFRLRPTAGTANGVHPVPLGFGRVYVHVDGEFSYEKWVDGLNAGRSFVTTGPVLFATVNKQPPGSRIVAQSGDRLELKWTARSVHPLKRVEIVRNGEPAAVGLKTNSENWSPGKTLSRESKITVDRSEWIAVRCFEELPGGRERFAHTAPIFIDVSDRPIVPKKREIEYLIQRVESQINRSKDVISPEGLAEYQKALEIYREIAKRAGE